MGYDDTDMGGADAVPVTSWGMVSWAASSRADRRAGLEALCARYWKPIYGYLRRALRRTDADAKDLTQEFLVWLTRSDLLERPQGAGVPFRSFLKGVLRNFVRNRDRSASTQRHGGDRLRVDLSAAATIPDDGAESPEQAFDHMWVDTLIEGALERARDRSSPEQFAVYEAYELGDAGAQPTYAEVAAALGLPVHTVRNHLVAVRERLRVELRAALRETVATGPQLELEWSELFRTL